MKLIGVGKLFLQAWGMWPFEAIQTDSRRKLYKAYRVFIIGWYTLFNASQTVECIRLIIRHESFERISKCVSVLFTTVLLFWKGIIYLKNDIPQMCLKVEEAEDALSKLNDEKLQNTYQQMLRSNRFVNICYIVSSLFTLMGFIVVSLIDVVIVGPEEFWRFNNASFMHELYLPFDQKKYCYFIMIGNIVTAVDSIVLNDAIQTAFFGLTMYASLRFKMLSTSLNKIYEIPSNNGDITIIFKRYLKEHQDSIRFVDQLNEAIKNVLLVSFFMNSVKIACVLCQVMAITDIAVLLFPVFLLLLLISEVFFLGWLCNEVKEQSGAIADAAYNILWYNENDDVKLMMQIMIMRAQKPSVMSIGPFGEMSTDTIVKTLKAGYSYATLVMNQKS